MSYQAYDFIVIYHVEDPERPRTTLCGKTKQEPTRPFATRQRWGSDKEQCCRECEKDPRFGLMLLAELGEDTDEDINTEWSNDPDDYLPKVFAPISEPSEWDL